MTKTLDLITKLSCDIKPVKPLGKPLKWFLNLTFLLIFYAVIVQIFFGMRSDILAQLKRPLFALEVILMLLLFFFSTASATFTMYPDLYQKSRLLKIPYIIFFALFAIFLAQFFTTNDQLMVLPEVTLHKMECTICIMFLSLIPAAITFAILQKGASTLPLQSGIFTILSASALGYLMLRFQEQNDSISHLLIWHYLPILFFALVGALIGWKLLKW